MEDVARIAGVNKATVSRALRGDPRISSSTREKIWKIAKEMEYRLDLAASGLSGGKTGIVALVLDESRPWFSPLFFEGLNRVLLRAGMDLLLKMPGFHPEEIFSSLGARHVDCILWAGDRGENLVVAGDKIPAPLVTVGFSVPAIPSVLLSEGETLRRLEKIAEGHSLRYFPGDAPLFPFLSSLAPMEGEAEEDVFSIFDGVDLDWKRHKPRQGCVCLPQGGQRLLDMYCLEWPAFEMGITAGRVLLNAFHKQGTYPVTTFLVPSLWTPAGEQLPYVKDQNKP